VLFVFVVMMVNTRKRRPSPAGADHARRWGPGAGTVFYRAAWLVARERAMPLLAASETPPVKDFGTVSGGGLLFSDFLFPFEAISLLLLVAIIGGVMLTRHFREDGSRVPDADLRVHSGFPACSSWERPVCFCVATPSSSS